MVIDRSFWKHRRVLLTGHTGFKGSWLSLLLRDLGADVTGIALAPDSHSLFELAGVARNIRDLRVDIRDRGALAKSVAETRPEIVFHLAAQALVRSSYRDPIETFETNVMGTANLLDALRSSADLKATVIVTSDKVYRSEEWTWAYRETDTLGGRDPYSASKAAAEIITASMSSSFLSAHAPVVTARAGNVIGGGDFAVDRLIPDIFRALQENRPLLLRSRMAIRPWQHVIDPLLGYLVLAEAVASGRSLPDAFNFGPSTDDVMSVGEVVDQFLTAFGRRIDVEVDKGENLHETMSLRVDASRARTLLGWRPLLTVSEAIASAAKWYRSAAEGEDLAALTRSEVQKLLERVGGR
ncbi:CDP-glucose 4,6-dehydratase [Bradyrhizobium sp. A5]|uniref:CDP-glucose 4,6-dehydratase n=1 Tax=Bradyrhizobium sp. A5 TaxID=3133696 RepID=UPI00324DE386